MVKIITSSISHQDLENKINEFIKNEIQAVKFDIKFSITPMHEFAWHQSPTVINTWIDYTALIIY